MNAWARRFAPLPTLRLLNWVGVAGATEHLDLNWSEYVPGYRTPAGTGTGLSFASWA